MHGDNQAGPPGFNRAVYLYSLGENETPRDWLALVPQEIVFTYGLAAEATIGALRNPVDAGPGIGGITPENFVPSRSFNEFLHGFLATEIYRQPAAQRQAAVQGSGYLYLLDRRTPDPTGTVPPEDIMGAVQISDGRLVPGTYQRNFNHRLFTRSGFFLLDEDLDRLLMSVVQHRATHRG